MNKCIFIGRFTKPLECRRTQGGTAVVTADIAVDSGYGEKKKTAFPTLVIWGKSAEFISRHADKGTMVEAVGEYTERKWEDRDGRKRTSVEIKVEDIKILSGWIGGEQTEQAEQATQYGGYDGLSESRSYSEAQYSEIDGDVGELPF